MDNGMLPGDISTKFTFGKYDGDEVMDVIFIYNDWEYLDWLLGQDWFMQPPTHGTADKYRWIREEVLHQLEGCQEWNNYVPHGNKDVVYYSCKCGAKKKYETWH